MTNFYFCMVFAITFVTNLVFSVIYFNEGRWDVAGVLMGLAVAWSLVLTWLELIRGCEMGTKEERICLSEYVSLIDFDAVGDWVADDSSSPQDEVDHDDLDYEVSSSLIVDPSLIIVGGDDCDLEETCEVNN